jgi:hypothetical protein
MNWSLFLFLALVVLMVVALVAGVASTGKERLVPKRTTRAASDTRPRVGH